MGEIRIVGPGKMRGFPFPECKNNTYILYHFNVDLQMFANCCLLVKCVLWGLLNSTGM